MSLDGTANYFPLTINGLQDVSADSQTVTTLQVNSLTPNRVVVSDSNNYLTSAGATAQEVDYLIGTTSSVQNQLNTKASLTYVDTNFLNKTTSTQQNITAFCDFKSDLVTDSVYARSSYYIPKTTFSTHGWNITRQLNGSVLKDLLFRELENNVDCLLLSEDGQTVYVSLKCDYATASKIPIFDANKKLISSGVDAIKITYLDNVSSDIQTQLNSKLNLSGSNANQNIVIGAYKVQSTATPTVADDLTRKGYVDSLVSNLLTSDNTWTGINTFSRGTSPIVLSGLTGNRLLGLGVAKDIQTINATLLEGSYLAGVTSGIQGQLDGKGNLATTNTWTATNTFSATNPINLSFLSGQRALILDASKNIQVSTTTSTELGYVSGVTSGIQGQLNTLAGTFANYLPLTGGTISGDLVVNGANGIGLGSTAVTSGYLGPRYYLSGRGDNQDDVGADNKFGPWYGLGASGVPGYTGVPCLAGYFGLALRTASNFMIMNQTGDVGIGTTSVLARCHIAYAGGNEFLVLNNTNYTTGDYINQQFRFGSTGTVRSAYIQGFLTTNNETDLKFFNANSGGTVAERMIIKGNGTVGIGTGTPDTTLNVWGNLKVHEGSAGPPANGTNGSTGTRLILWPGGGSSTPYALGIDASTLWYGVPTGATHKWYSGVNNTMILDGSGNLTAAGSVTCAGLQCNGTANTRNLQIERTYNINVSNGDTSQAQILFGWSGTQSQYRHNIRTGHDGGGGVGNANNRMDFYLWGSNDAVGAQGSNIRLSINGASTSVLSRALNVAGTNPYAITSGLSGRAGQLVIGGDENFVNGWSSGLLMECSDQTEFAVHDYGARVASFMYYNANTFTIGRDTGWGLSTTIIAGGLLCNGAVGIGTASPTALLHVYGNQDAGLVSYVQNASAGSSAYALFACIAETAVGALVLFQNSSARGADGGVRTGTLRNDGGTLRLQSRGGGGITISENTGTTTVYNTTSTYNNSFSVNTPWASVLLDSTQSGGGRKYVLMSSINGAGVGGGSFAIWDESGGAYRLSINSGGTTTIHTDLNVPGISTVETPNGQTNNRLLFRDAGTGLVRIGACSTWNVTYTTIAFTYGVMIDYAFYVPNDTCTIQIDLTGSGYSAGIVAQTVLEIFVYPMFVGTPYVQYGIPFFFNQTYSHTQATLHATIPNNAWGGSTVGWKRIYAQWIYAAGGAIASDANDTLNMNIRVIG